MIRKVSPEQLAIAFAQAQEYSLKLLDLPSERLAALTDRQRAYLDFMRRARSGKLSAEAREKIVAFHEAGHCVAEALYGAGHLVQVSILPNDFSDGHVHIKVPQEKLFPLTEDTIKRMFLCSLAGPFAEMYLTGMGDDSADHRSLYAFCKKHGLPDEEIRNWELHTCREERDEDPVPGVNFFVVDNLRRIFHVACVLYEQKTLTGQEVRALLQIN